jgi:hypothetical protein
MFYSKKVTILARLTVCHKICEIDTFRWEKNCFLYHHRRNLKCLFWSLACLGTFTFLKTHRMVDLAIGMFKG